VSHDGHLAQSFLPIALWFIPVHLCVLDMRPHFPLANMMLWPGVPQRVQIVTGLGRFMQL
jgi:hypothetical protein